MQLLAACPERAPAAAAGREVDDDRLRRQQPRPGHVHRGHGAAPAAALRLRQGRRRGRGLRPRLRPPPPRRRGHAAALRQRDRPARPEPDQLLLPAPGGPDGRSGTTRGCSSSTRTTCSPSLQHAALAGIHGTFNVAGDGIVMLSQAVRRLQRPSVPLPAVAVGNLGSVLRQARVAEFSPEQLGLLTFGRGVDTTRMREVLDFHPRHTTAEAFADFAAPLSPTGGRTTRLIDRAVPAGRRRPGAARADGSRPWVTPRSSRSAPAADPAAAPAPTGRPPPPAGLAPGARPRTRRAAPTRQPEAAASRPEPAGDAARAAPPAPAADRPSPPRRRPPASARRSAGVAGRRLARARSSTLRARCSATTGSPSWRGSSRSCAAGSPATTTSTSTASTPRSPSAS